MTLVGLPLIIAFSPEMSHTLPLPSPFVQGHSAAAPIFYSAGRRQPKQAGSNRMYSWWQLRCSCRITCNI